MAEVVAPQICSDCGVDRRLNMDLTGQCERAEHFEWCRFGPVYRNQRAFEVFKGALAILSNCVGAEGWEEAIALSEKMLAVIEERNR